MEEVTRARNAIRHAIDNNSPSGGCSGCPGLVWKEWPDDDEPHRIAFKLAMTFESPCNLECSYCNQKGFAEEKEGALMKLTENVIERGLVAPDAVFAYVCGEPTVHKNFNEWLRLIVAKTPNRLLLYTNGVKFSPEIADLLHSGRALVCVSLDACDRLTWLRIKKRDCFEDVLRNIRAYHTYGGKNFVLKYNVLAENAHEPPEAFFILARELGIEDVTVNINFHLPTGPAEIDKLAAMHQEAARRNVTMRGGGKELLVTGASIPDGYMDRDAPYLGPETRKRTAWHAAGNGGYNHYQIPALPVLLRDDAIFAFELHFLLTGTILAPEERVFQGKRAAAFPSRFQYALDAYYETRKTSAAWLAGQTDYAHFWRACQTILGRMPTENELCHEENYALTLGQTISLFFVSSEFRSRLRLTSGGINLSGAAREDIFLLYAVILLRFPESEEEIHRGMHCASLSQLALTLLASPEFERMKENLRVARARACSETTPSMLRADARVENYPRWLGELLHDCRELTLFQLWTRHIRKPDFLSIVKGTEVSPAPTAATSRTVLCFGTGYMAANLVPALDRELVHIAAFIDERRERHGTEFMGAPVIGLTAVREFAYDHVLVCARPYERLKNKLLDSGVPETAIVSGDIETILHGAAGGAGMVFTRSLEALMDHSPFLRDLLDTSKIAASDWTEAANERLSQLFRSV
jgi:Predicted Fe-S oxidoreductases